MARSGHPPPALVHPDGTVSIPDLPTGPPLGLGGLPFETAAFPLPEGSRLVLYTDGLLGDRHHDVDASLERLRRALSHPARSPEDTCEEVVRAVVPPHPDDWIIVHSHGHAGVVVFTDDSIPFARNKSELIEKELATCAGVRLLAEENIPIADTSSRTPQEVSSLLSRFRDSWTHSAAINDVYFADAAPALRAARRKGRGVPFNIGAGDGDPSAFQRINSGQFQAATVPEPFAQQGWQILDEFNRAFSGRPASGYVAPVHIATAANSGGATTWDPPGYRAAYLRIWGR